MIKFYILVFTFKIKNQNTILDFGKEIDLNLTKSKGRYSFKNKDGKYLGIDKNIITFKDNPTFYFITPADDNGWKIKVFGKCWERINNGVKLNNCKPENNQIFNFIGNCELCIHDNSSKDVNNTVKEINNDLIRYLMNQESIKNINNHFGIEKKMNDDDYDDFMRLTEYVGKAVLIKPQLNLGFKSDIDFKDNRKFNDESENNNLINDNKDEDKSEYKNSNKKDNSLINGNNDNYLINDNKDKNKNYNLFDNKSNRVHNNEILNPYNRKLRTNNNFNGYSNQPLRIHLNILSD